MNRTNYQRLLRKQADARRKKAAQEHSSRKLGRTTSYSFALEVPALCWGCVAPLAPTAYDHADWCMRELVVAVDDAVKGTVP